MEVFSDIGSYSTRGPRTGQQDAYFYSADKGIVGVFDGHGARGDKASETAKNYLLERYGNHNKFMPDDLTGDFAAINRRMPHDSGTTATVVRLTPPRVRSTKVAWNNVGDSPALLIDPYTGQVDDLYIAHDITNDSEVERICEDEDVLLSGKHFMNERYDGLAVSRALGKYPIPRIIPTPDNDVRFFSGEKILLVTSDGIINDHTREDVLEELRRLYQVGRRMGDIAYILASEFSFETGDNATAVVAHIPDMERY